MVSYRVLAVGGDAKLRGCEPERVCIVVYSNETISTHLIFQTAYWAALFSCEQKMGSWLPEAMEGDWVLCWSLRRPPLGVYCLVLGCLHCDRATCWTVDTASSIEERNHGNSCN